MKYKIYAGESLPSTTFGGETEADSFEAVKSWIAHNLLSGAYIIVDEMGRSVFVIPMALPRIYEAAT